MSNDEESLENGFKDGIESENLIGELTNNKTQGEDIEELLKTQVRQIADLENQVETINFNIESEKDAVKVDLIAGLYMYGRACLWFGLIIILLLVLVYICASFIVVLGRFLP